MPSDDDIRSARRAWGDPARAGVRPRRAGVCHQGRAGPFAQATYSAGPTGKDRTMINFQVDRSKWRSSRLEVLRRSTRQLALYVVITVMTASAFISAVVVSVSR